MNVMLAHGYTSQDPIMTELLTKALQTSQFLCAEVREAHKASCKDNPLLEILLRDALLQTQTAHGYLNNIAVAWKEAQSESR